MNLWPYIDEHRVKVADFLTTLAPDEWDRPSLCDGWTIRHVAGHLTMQQTGLSEIPALLGAMVKARGNLNRAIRDSARDRSRQPTEQLIASIRGMVGSTKHNIGVTPQETLIDILVHSQDIAVPLGRSLPLNPEAATIAAQRVWAIRYFKAQQRFEGFRLIATDVDFAVGTGQEVKAPIDQLLLRLTGRPADTPPR